jgi:hypothetical protein
VTLVVLLVHRLYKTEGTTFIVTLFFNLLCVGNIVCILAYEVCMFLPAVY